MCNEVNLGSTCIGGWEAFKKEFWIEYKKGIETIVLSWSGPIL